MDYHMRWHHVVTCCCVMCANCAYYAYVTIHCALGVACFGSRHFVNTVSGQHFSAENKQEAAEFYSQHLPMHFRGVIWKIKSKTNFPVSLSLISAEMNLVGNYRTLRGLQTINPEGLPSIMLPHGISTCDGVFKTTNMSTFSTKLSTKLSMINRYFTSKLKCDMRAKPFPVWWMTIQCLRLLSSDPFPDSERYLSFMGLRYTSKSCGT